MAMTRSDAIVIRRATTYAPSTWRRKLNGLYGKAKRRNRGYSLSIYSDVAAALDVLDGDAPMPDGFAMTLDNLAGRLRRS
jgi:hypothetical protein